jgi:hypothetical protein
MNMREKLAMERLCCLLNHLSDEQLDELDKLRQILGADELFGAAVSDFVSMTLMERRGEIDNI